MLIMELGAGKQLVSNGKQQVFVCDVECIIVYMYVAITVNVLLCSLCCKQECPTGIVNEETFKDIYAQFFPQILF